MRGVCLHGRRPPANRSAGPVRPPVVPAAVRAPRGAVRGPAASPPPAGDTRRAAPHGTAPVGSTTRYGAAHVGATCGSGTVGPPSRGTGSGPGQRQSCCHRLARRWPAPIADAGTSFPARAASLRPPSSQPHHSSPRDGDPPPPRARPRPRACQAAIACRVRHLPGSPR